MNPETVLPAYAGVILKAIYPKLTDAGASRVCGGDPEFKIPFDSIFQCFPRMRG